jgi:NADH:ubiquinone oxidoreductase subunit F (NADH-binding)
MSAIHETAASVHRLLTPAAGPLVTPDLDTLLHQLELSGLTGRGGAGFPTHRKLAAVAGARRPALVVNAMEGEPGSAKDRTLLEVNPDLVARGVRVLRHVLGRGRSVIALGTRVPDPGIRAALQQVGGSEVEVVRPADGFLAGQESALIAALNSRPGVPGDPLVPVWQRGLGGRPSLVLNVETVAQVALVAAHGGEWFASVGVPSDPGTSLVTVGGTSHDVVTGGVREVVRGTPLDAVLRASGMVEELVGAVLVGGYHGAWLSASELATGLDRGSLDRFGASVGAGVLMVQDRRQCPLRITAQIVAELAAAGAGQCGPCAQGMPALARTLTGLATAPVRGVEPDPVAQVHHLMALVDGRGACAHPTGTVRLVRSTLRVFADHVAAHLEGRCR